MSELLAGPLCQAPALARLLGGRPHTLTLLAGGRNSRVYRATAADGQVFAVKAYFRHEGDNRDRLGAEMTALAFLRRHGLACVPRPIASDPEAGLGLYEFIEGQPPLEATATDMDAAAEFLLRVRSLRLQPDAAGLPLASEARFSLAAVVANIEARLRSLETGAPALAPFLRQELAPVWRGLLLRLQPGGFERELPLAERTLSPSDFGLHNALRRNGALVFLDFEYFGWDDPAKLIADFLLHPGMDLSLALRVHLAEAVLAGCPDQPGLRQRVRQAYPLFAMKWCLILLNEFLPAALGRRQFAEPQAGAAEQRQARQLLKTREKLQWIRDDHDPFSC